MYVKVQIGDCIFIYGMYSVCLDEFVYVRVCVYDGRKNESEHVFFLPFIVSVFLFYPQVPICFKSQRMVSN